MKYYYYNYYYHFCHQYYQVIIIIIIILIINIRQAHHNWSFPRSLPRQEPSGAAPGRERNTTTTSEDSPKPTAVAESTTNAPKNWKRARPATAWRTMEGSLSPTVTATKGFWGTWRTRTVCRPRLWVEISSAFGIQCVLRGLPDGLHWAQVGIFFFFTLFLLLELSS